jgi:hypothetical protein
MVEYEKRTDCDEDLIFIIKKLMMETFKFSLSPPPCTSFSKG